MKTNKKFAMGLKELVISACVIVIVLLVTIPTYRNYERKMYFRQIVAATVPYRLAINACIVKQSLKQCAEPRLNGAPKSFDTSIVKSINVVYRQLAGKEVIVITAIPNSAKGIDENELFTLTGIISPKAKRLVWLSGGEAFRQYD